MTVDAILSENIAFSEAFGLPGHVTPVDQLVTLTYGQLQDLIREAVQEATEPILQELEALRTRQDALESRISSREVQPPAETEIVALGAILQARDQEIRKLRTTLELLEETTARERAYDRQRIANMERRDPIPSEKTMDHIDDLHGLMRKEGHPPLSMARAARLLGISKARMKQLKPLIAKDERFEIVRDPHHKQRLLVRPRRFGGR